MNAERGQMYWYEAPGEAAARTARSGVRLDATPMILYHVIDTRVFGTQAADR